VVAAVHAGWRGSLARVAAEAVRVLKEEAGVPPARLLACVGPSIGPCCYEVSAELGQRFSAELGPDLVHPGARSPRLDLWAANRKALLEAGLLADRVETLRRCTSCEAAVFFSHRRDGGRTGRQVAFVAARAPTPSHGGAGGRRFGLPARQV